MTARAFPNSILGRALGKDTLHMTEQERQRLIVLVSSEGISTRLVEMCAALDIELIPVSSHHDLPFRLHHSRPIGVISEIDGRSIESCASLRNIAAYDPDMPVLLVAGDDPVVLGTIDAAEQLWDLSGIRRLADQPSARDLIDFLFQAGREAGTGRLVPLS